MADSTSASYAVVRELGEGGEGVVLLVRRRDTGALHALKRRHCGATIADANCEFREGGPPQKPRAARPMVGAIG
jgi:hypothetical protein